MLDQATVSPGSPDCRECIESWGCRIEGGGKRVNSERRWRVEEMGGENNQLVFYGLKKIRP